MKKKIIEYWSKNWPYIVMGSILTAAVVFAIGMYVA